MDLGIKNRVALVTAASRGLGKAVALQLAQEGARVAMCSRSQEAIQRAADDIAGATGIEVLPLACDVTDAEQVKRAVAEVVSKLGDIEILVTNAGGPPAGMVADFAPDDYRSAAELNLFSTIELVYAAERLLELALDPDCNLPDFRVIPTETPSEGIGIVEAPRGTLTHHYDLSLSLSYLLDN